MSRVETPPAAPTYRPLSALALLGLLVSLFAPLLFLLDQAWFFVLSPLLGLMLCVLARRRIRRSQGSLGGMAFAAAGIVLSVACGLGWLTSLVTEQYLLAYEAEAFLSGWIAVLQEKEKEGEVFLGTVEPKSRQIDFPPADHRRLRAHFPPPRGAVMPQFDAFRANPFMATLLRYPGRLHLRPLGRRGNVSYKPGEHVAQFAYHLESPVVVGEVVFTVKSQMFRTPRGERREWYLVLTATDPKLPPEPTPYGKKVQVARQLAQREIERTIDAIHRDVYADVPGRFAADSQSELARLVSFLRREVPPKDPSRWQGFSALLLDDQQVGAHGWRLRYRVRLITAQQEMEQEMTLTTDDDRKPDSWRFAACKFLSIRKKREALGGDNVLSAPGSDDTIKPQP